MVVDRSPDRPAPPDLSARWPGGPEVDRLFHALADATRRDIVTVSLQEPRSVSALARRYPMSGSAGTTQISVVTILLIIIIVILLAS